MKKRGWIGLDQGSSSTKGVLIGDAGDVRHTVRVPVSRQRSGPEVTQDPEELFLSVESARDELLDRARAEQIRVVSLGLAVQRSGVLAWDAESGRSLSCLLTWEDTRVSGALPRGDLVEEVVRRKTSLPILPNYAAGKISLLQREFSDPQVAVTTLDSFLMFRLAGGGLPSTEPSMASRTLLFDLCSGQWDDELCRIFLINGDRLPILRSSTGSWGISSGISCDACLGDQQAGLVAAMRAGGDGLLNLGTIAAFMTPLEQLEEPQRGYFVNVLLRNPEDRDALFIEGIVPSMGRVIECAQRVAEIPIEKLGALYRDVMRDPCAPLVYATLGGTGTPFWRERSETCSSASRCEGIALSGALLENLVFQLAQCGGGVQQIAHTNLRRILVSGGGAELGPLIGDLASLIGLDLYPAGEREMTAIGAAVAAGAPVPHAAKTQTAFGAFRSADELQMRYRKWLELQDNALGISASSAFPLTLPWP